MDAGADTPDFLCAIRSCGPFAGSIFYATKGVKRYYIQVCADISNAETKAREERPYILLNDEVTKIMVINKPVKESLDENGFTIIGIAEFLLNYI